MNEFLPDGYTAPVADSNYFKLQQGENTFRVLGSAIVGWVYWNTEGKPVRLRRQPESTPTDMRNEKGRTEKVKHFWAFPVWSYKLNKVQVMELTQSTIMSAMEALVKNPKWGAPTGYDITITRTGEGLDTEYSVVPEPHTEGPVTNPPALNLEALFEGGDPFASVAL